MISSSTKTFNGGNTIHPIVLNQAGAGKLVIVGNNTLNDITSTITAASSATIEFTAGSTTSVKAFNADGTFDYNLTLASSVPGVSFNLVKV
jgi:hypothetical protein